MNIVVRFAVPFEAITELEAIHSLGESAPWHRNLPDGFPFIVDDETGKIPEAPLIYMADEFMPRSEGGEKLAAKGVRVQRHARLRYNTAKAAAYDLKDWLAWVAATDRSWNKIRADDLKAYVSFLLSVISPKTHRPLSTLSIRRYLTNILSFYDWAAEHRYFAQKIDHKEAYRHIRSMDEIALAHTSSNWNSGGRSVILPSNSGSRGDRIHPLTADALRSVLAHCGALPPVHDNYDPNDRRPTRDRLIALLSYITGTRADEIAKLKIWQILGLTANMEPRSGAQLLHLTETKGLIPGDIKVPNWLVDCLHWYRLHERAAAIKEGRKRNPRLDPDAFWVNGKNARHNAGKPIAAASISEAFRKAVIAAGLIELAHLVDPETGDIYTEEQPKHSFHDLRHTFAVVLYVAEKLNGNAEPWKVVQTECRHKQLTTTINTYLKVTNDYESEITDRIMKRYQHLREYSNH